MMKRNSILVAVMCAATLYPAIGRADDSALAWSNRYVLLTTQVESQLRPIVEDIMQDPRQRDRATGDLLAELLLHFKAANTPLRSLAFDMLRIITAGRDGGRYYDVASGMHRYIDANGSLQYFHDYELLNRGDHGEQYVPGSVDLDTLRKQYVADALAATPSAAQAQALADLPTNATLDQMFAAAGKPAFVASRDVRLHEVVATVEVRRLWFFYRGIGRMAYDYQRGTGWVPHEFVADPMAFEAAMPYRAQAAELGMPDERTLAMIQLMSGNPSAIKESAQSSYRRGDPPLEYLDAAAEMLLEHHAEIANTGANDAYAWICNVLSDRGGPRYSGVLAAVARQTTDRKLAKYAGQSVKKRSNVPATPYVAGAVSLAALASKYPSLYPQSTLIRGLL
jgi:hypothetical protein